ncbi:MAG TPA: HypC/HybG/HupF family hydrogenase formation chaperone [Roseiflexaceae bacterium]|nr:HypC/HybG/HupF family hydrogenase formation chaperone [Roseiflexaceae bacterium]
MGAERCQDDRCVTCADQALRATVLQIHEAGLALVALADETVEIDITLVDDIAPGDQVLVHGGVAIARL